MFLAELFSFMILTNGHDGNLEKCISVLCASSLVHLILHLQAVSLFLHGICQLVTWEQLSPS